MFIEFNPNPERKIVDDCVVRAICKLFNKDWEYVYTDLYAEGLEVHDWPWKNYVWGRYLTKHNYIPKLIPNTCPDCFTVKEFCRLFPKGSYLLATGEHVVTVVDGNYYDTWDSGDEVPVYYWSRKEI